MSSRALSGPRLWPLVGLRSVRQGGEGPPFGARRSSFEAQGTWNLARQAEKSATGGRALKYHQRRMEECTEAKCFSTSSVSNIPSGLSTSDRSGRRHEPGTQGTSRSMGPPSSDNARWTYAVSPHPDLHPAAGQADLFDFAQPQAQRQMATWMAAIHSRTRDGQDRGNCTACGGRIPTARRRQAPSHAPRKQKPRHHGRGRRVTCSRALRGERQRCQRLELFRRRHANGGRPSRA